MSLPIAVESSLLPTKEWEEINALSDELSKAYATRQIFRTDTEARVSVLDDIHHPTKAAKYWQSVREQTVMLEQLALLSFEYRRNEAAIKRHQLRLANGMADAIDLEEAQIDIDECMFKRANMKTVAADRAREIKMWSQIKSEVNDGSFDTNNVNTHQLVSYTTQFALMAATINKEQMSGDEFANLMGQLQTCMVRCEQLGVVQQVIANLPQEVAKQLQITSQP